MSGLSVVRRGALFTLIAAFLSIGAMVPLTRPAAAAPFVVRWVNNAAGFTATPPGTGCYTPGYTTIQAAINAAGPGDMINVCNGTYLEQLTISGAAKNNITLTAVTNHLATIKAPAVMAPPGDLITVTGATNVTIQRFIISGPLPDAIICGGFAGAGINIMGGGSAVITGNQITRIEGATPAVQTCTAGIAILVGRQSAGQVGSATISGNQIDNYQQGGIVVDNSGSSAIIQGNTVTGFGPTTLIAQNGIQISRGATADLSTASTQNMISGNVFTPQFTAATGLLLFFPATVTVRTLTVTSNDVGVYDFGQFAPTNTTLLYSVNAQRSTFEGILLTSISTATVDRATAFNNGSAGIVASAGIHLLSDATGNTVSNSTAYNNQPLDCLDESTGAGTAGTANTWTADNGATDSPHGICNHRPVFPGQGGPVNNHAKPSRVARGGVAPFR